jgi:hypothetical protein
VFQSNALASGDGFARSISVYYGPHSLWPDGETLVDVSFLVDPILKTVASVQDGYSRAGELIGTDLTDTATLWGDAADSDTSVEVIVADDALTNNTISRGFFKVTLALENVRVERVLAGKAVLNAYGSPPPDIKEQVRTLKAVRERVSFISVEDAFQWFEENTGGSPFSLEG